MLGVSLRGWAGGMCHFSAPSLLPWLLHHLFRNNFKKKPAGEMQNKEYFNTAPKVFI